MRTLVQAIASLSSMVVIGVAGGALVLPGALQAETAPTPPTAPSDEPAAPVVPGAKGKVLPPAPGAKSKPALSPDERRAALEATVPTIVKADANPEVMHFGSMCGASAAITLDDERVILGNDDDNLIRTYDIVEPQALEVKDDAGKVDPKRVRVHRPRAVQNLYKFLKVNQFSRRNFSAIEGAAVGDGFVFWTGSHARRHDGENRPNRRRFFATRIVNVAGLSILEPYGKPVMDLVQQIEAADALKPVGLSRSIMSVHRQLEFLAPEARGFEIGSLSMAADGKTLLIGVRNPTQGGSAIVVPVANPVEVADGGRAIFGEPILLPMAGRSMTAMEWVPSIGAHVIVAGEKNAHDGFVLLRWSGRPGEAPARLQALPEGFDVQSFVVGADGKRLLVFSDDSTRPQPVQDAAECKVKPSEGQCACSDLTDHGRRFFRALWVPVDLNAAQPSFTPAASQARPAAATPTAKPPAAVPAPPGAKP